MDVDMNDARAEAADVIALDDASMAVEADDDATPGSLFHGAQIVATDEDDHERDADASVPHDVEEAEEDEDAPHVLARRDDDAGERAQRARGGRSGHGWREIRRERGIAEAFVREIRARRHD